MDEAPELGIEEAVVFLRKVSRSYVYHQQTVIDDAISLAILRLLQSGRTAWVHKEILQEFRRAVGRVAYRSAHPLLLDESHLAEIRSQNRDYEELEVVNAVETWLQTLEADEKQLATIILANREQGLEDAEMARRLGWPPSTFSSRKKRLMSSLLRWLQMSS